MTLGQPLGSCGGAQFVSSRSQRALPKRSFHWLINRQGVERSRFEDQGRSHARSTQHASSSCTEGTESVCVGDQSQKLPAQTLERSGALGGRAFDAEQQQRPLPALAHPIPASQQQQAATRSVAALAAAWDQLAPRLPLELGNGHGAELILSALKLALAAGGSSSNYGRRPAPAPAQRALATALRLADLASGGLPLDAEAIAAGILAEALCRGEAMAVAHAGQHAAALNHSLALIEQRVGAGVAHLVHDVLRVRALPSRVDIYDDEAASALRELCLAFYDVRATAVEVAARLEGLVSLAGSPSLAVSSATVAAGPAAPKYERQVAALEALQIYAPLGHALGMGGLAAQLEDACFQLLFPESYARTAAWLRHESSAGQDTLQRCQEAIRAAVLGQPQFLALASGLQVHGRTKSLFSTLKKLLRLGETSRGGRSRAEIYDLMGMRLVVQPRRDLPEAEAEALAGQACYLVREAACSLWEPVPGRCKDYIAAPKLNGYQSLHSTLRVRGDAGGSSLATNMEVQVRTQAMHEHAESGQAAHTAYKGGLAPSQARQLRAWTDERSRLLLLSSRSIATPAAAPPAAGEVLFRHLDRNGDGRLSLGELREALMELGVFVGDEEGRGAEELMALVDTDADGTIDLEEFLDFHQKAGLVRAISEVDHETAEQLEAQVHPGSSSSSSNGGGGSSSIGVGLGGVVAAAVQRPSLPLRAASPWTAARRGILSWAARNLSSPAAMHVNGSGGSGAGSSSSRVVSAAASVDVLSSSSSLSELEEEQPGIITISSRQGTPANGAARNGSNEAKPAQTAASAAAAPEAPVASSRSGRAEGYSSADEVSRSSPPPRLARAMKAALRPIVRVWQGNAPLPATAEWSLVPSPSNAHPVTGSVGQVLPAISLPEEGPCVVGAVRNRDCDVVLDVPTVSGRHARLWVKRQAGTSQLYVCDVGSTNGTWVNRYRIKPWTDVALYPGDLVEFAQLDVEFIVQLKPAAPAAQRRGAAATAQALPAAVSAALAAASALEGAAAEGGVFPAPADGAPSAAAEAAQRARELMAGKDYVAARMLLLGEVMRHPMDGGLWAQLANLEGNLAKHAASASPALAGPPSFGTARAFYGAAAACFSALLPPLPPPPARKQQDQQQQAQQDQQQQAQQQQQQAQQAEEGQVDLGAVRGVCRALSSWAQMEYSQGNARTGRSLFRQAVQRAQQHPEGAAAVDLPRLLFTFAHKEWKQGDAAVAAELAKEVTALQPSNHYALALLGNIKQEAKQLGQARRLFQKALEAEPAYITALQSWARLEADAGLLWKARELFERALHLEPSNTFVLQAWAVAEGREGNVNEARALFARTLAVDPGCRSALHAWAKLEEEQGAVEKARELYSRVLQLSPSNIKTLCALGRLERLAGREEEAERLLTTALRLDRRCASALSELSLLRAAQGATEEAEWLGQESKAVTTARRSQLSKVKRRRSQHGSGQRAAGGAAEAQQGPAAQHAEHGQQAEQQHGLQH